MSLLQISETSANFEFRNKVHAAMFVAALQIVGEASGTMSPAMLTKRHNLGCAVLNGGYLDSFAKALAGEIGEVADPATILDADIQSTISAVWDDIAGVTGAEAAPV